MTKLGVSFSGGGVKAAASVGIMQALYENSIKPDIYVGTSGGAIVACLLANGFKPQDVLENFKLISNKLIDIAYGHIIKGTFTRSYIEGFVSGNHLERLVDSMTDSYPISKIYKPLGVVTTDIDTGDAIVITNMPSMDESKLIYSPYEVWYTSDIKISEAIRSSCSIPPVFIPKHLKGRKLVDGGLVDNLPSDVAIALGADKVISIDLGYSGMTDTKGAIDIARMSFDILMRRTTTDSSKDYGYYLNPQVFDISVLDVDKIEEAYHRGYSYASSVIEDVKHYLGG